MSWFPRPSSPRAAIRDFAAFMRQRSREQVIGAALALLVTAIIVIEFIVDAKIGTAPPPQVDRGRAVPSNRTDAEIVADQKKDQAAKEAAQERAATAIPEARETVRDVTGPTTARFMAEAVRLGEEARGQSAPNPNVGCVIVSSAGEIVGRGATAPRRAAARRGRRAREAGSGARGATVYVTLEPCAHAQPARARPAPTCCSRRSRRGS